MMLKKGGNESGVCGNSLPSSQFFYKFKIILKMLSIFFLKKDRILTIKELISREKTHIQQVNHN